MNCQENQELLSAYLDRELSQEDQKEVACHLESCTACKAELSSLLAIKEKLRGMHLPSMPADLVAQIEAQTLFRAPWWEKRLLWGVPTVAVAAALGVWAVLHLRGPVAPRAPMNMPLAQLMKEPTSGPRAMVAWRSDSDSDTTKDLQ